MDVLYLRSTIPESRAVLSKDLVTPLGSAANTEGVQRKERTRLISKSPLWRCRMARDESAIGGAFSPSGRGGVFLFHPAFFFVALGEFCLMMAISRKSPCFIFSFAASSTLLDGLKAPDSQSQPFCRHECRTPLQTRKTPSQIWIMNYTRKAEIG